MLGLQSCSGGCGEVIIEKNTPLCGCLGAGTIGVVGCSLSRNRIIITKGVSIAILLGNIIVIFPMAS